MNNISSLQNLVNSVNGVRHKIEEARLSVLLHSKSYDSKSSEYHFKFDKLMNKFSGFAEEYRFELDQFHKLLLNNIEALNLQQAKEKNERELAVIMGKLETISNSNNEIVDNLAEIDNNSPAASIKMQNDNSYSVTVRTPTPVPVIKNKTNNNNTKSTKKHTKNNNKTAKKKSSNTRKSANTNKPKTVPKAHKSIANNEQKQKQNSNDNNSISSSDNNSTKAYMDTPYSYDPNTAAWVYRGPAKSSTRIFVGNLPYDMTKQRLQSWIRTRAHVGPTQINETQIRNGARGKYALVRFGNDITIHKIKVFMNKINTENDDIYKQRQEDKEKMNLKGKSSKKNDIISWKKRVYLKFHRGYKMYDTDANCTLFIRNFDILDAKCHSELTQKLLECGDLVGDIKISLDSFNDPFCIATFKDIDDAMYCCNSEIEFNGRIVEMRYSRK